MKSESRKKAKRILASADRSYFAEASEKIAQKVINSDIFIKSDTVFVYVSTENEPDTEKIITCALSTGKTVCVPKCISKNEMKAVAINSLNELESGAFGIKEPPVAAEYVSKSEIELAVIPCVAAAQNGKRLGHGAGYYDRFLENTDMFKMCLCFEKLIFEDIPTDMHDIVMDEIVTET